MPDRDPAILPTAEPILDPEREIVDPHHHLWDRPGNRYLLSELQGDVTDGHRVVQTVFIQCRSMYLETGPEALRPVGEVAYMTGVADASAADGSGVQACAGIVGYADLRLGAEVAPMLGLLEDAGKGRFRGIRFPVGWHSDPAVELTKQPTAPGLMGEPAVRAGAKALAQAGHSLDLWVGHTQLGEVYDLARAVPGLTVIVDHVGGPIGVGPYAGRRTEVLADWRGAMAQLAELPNVHVKLGGLGMHVGGFAFDRLPLPPSSSLIAEAWRPYILGCIDLFGPDRCMFESNFPVDKGMVGYRNLWNAYKRLTEDFPEDERSALFAGTARRVYRLQAPSSHRSHPAGASNP